MNKALRLRRGTTEDYRNFIGAEGEITYDEDKKTVRVHDGETIGGYLLSRTDQAKGWTLQEHFVNSGTWTKVGKTGLKRIIVHCWGGGGGGGNNTDGGSGGGSGGYGYIVLDAANLTSNVAVTVAGGGNSGGGEGGASYFGSYILSNGGGGGQNNNYGIGGDPGRSYGDNVIEIGGFAGSGGGYSATAQTNYGWMRGTGGGPGGRRGSATGVAGGGGGAGGGNGAQGSILIQEIYGEV